VPVVGGRTRPWHEVVAKIDSREAGRPASAGGYRHGSPGRWRLLCEGRLFISKVCWCTRSEDGDRRLALSPRDGHGANQAHRAGASFRRPMVEPYARCPHICPVTGFRVVVFNSGRCRRCGRRGGTYGMRTPLDIGRPAIVTCWTSRGKNAVRESCTR
jgi:hypothetical protein